MACRGRSGRWGRQGRRARRGRPGLVYQGAYSSVGNYALGDVVVFDGASWVSLVAGNVGQTPGVGSGLLGGADVGRTARRCGARRGYRTDRASGIAG